MTVGINIAPEDHVSGPTRRHSPLVERGRPSANVIDVLDRVLDKGIVIEAWLRLSLAGIDLITVEGHFIVASIATYSTYANEVAEVASVSAQPLVVSMHRPRTLDEQLRLIRECLDASAVQDHEHRRAEDRILDELRDTRERIVRAAQHRSH